MDIRENKQIALLVCTADPFLFSLRIHNFIIDLNKLGLVIFLLFPEGFLKGRSLAEIARL